MNLLMGIDDTDDVESPGTGHRVRQLADWLVKNRLGDPKGITRHQLLVDSRIPYTSHNSAACMSIEVERLDGIWEATREYLIRESAPGSDVGLCLAQVEQVNESVVSFGRRAKLNLVSMSEAEQTASRPGLRLARLTGTGGGIIGALAAVGLRYEGNDGRFLWLPGLREMKGKYQISEFCARGHVDRICTLNNQSLAAETIVDVGDWIRPILRDGQATLYVEENHHEWYVIPKDQIKRLSN